MVRPGDDEMAPEDGLTEAAGRMDRPDERIDEGSNRQSAHDDTKLAPDRLDVTIDDDPDTQRRTYQRIIALSLR